jgi:hypothetical protein
MAGSWEYVSDSLKSEEYLDQLNNEKLLMKGPATWS